MKLGTDTQGLWEQISVGTTEIIRQQRRNTISNGFVSCSSDSFANGT